MPLRKTLITAVSVLAVAFGSAGTFGSDTAVASAAQTHTYRFPIAGCAASYARVHHDYPATDIFAARGCHFVAPIAGRVDEVSRVDRWSPATDLGSQRGGRSVSIVGVDGVRYYGSHLEGVAAGIRPGVFVHRGQVLGFVGHSGDASATHLHFGISWPTRRGIWWVRRGEVWPWRYLDAWRSGSTSKSPAGAVAAKLTRVGTRVPPCAVDC